VERWQEKVKLGIKPGQPTPVDNDQYMADNLEEVTNDE
jgi:hypothetical protein